MSTWVAMVWRGRDDDARLFISTFDGSSWTDQQVAGMGATSDGPALANVEGLAGFPSQTLFMAWKGFQDDPGLWWSSNGAGGGSWRSQAPADGTFRTSHGPALAVGARRLIMAWRGSTGASRFSKESAMHRIGRETKDTEMHHLPGTPPDPGQDGRLLWSIFDGASWFERQVVGPAAPESSHAPALTGNTTQAVMAWKGNGSEPRLSWSLFDGRSWSNPQLVAGGSVGTSDRPALAEFQGRVYMAWKGVGNDSKIWWSSLHEGRWEAQQSVADGGVGTSHGPALAVVDGKLMLAWKGKGNDSRLWWSEYSGAPPWSDQTQVTSRSGVAYETSRGPALAGFRVFDL